MSGRRLQLASVRVLAELAGLLELAGLPEREATCARAAGAANTLRVYRSDWVDVTSWCTVHDAKPMPASPLALTGYLVALAEAGDNVGTLSRLLSSIKFAHASAGNPDLCPVVALRRWLELAGSTEGPMFRGVTKANRVGQRRLHPKLVTTLAKGALARTGAPPTGYSGHPLRAAFVTYAHLRGSSDRTTGHQTRQRSMASLGGYVRVSHAWTDNAAAGLGL